MPQYLRQLVFNLIQMVLLDPMVRVRGLTSSARVTATKPEAPVDSTCIIMYAGGVDMIEEPIELRDAIVA